MRIVLVSRPSLISTLLNGRVMHVTLNPADDDGANKDTGTTDQGGLGKGLCKEGEPINVQLTAAKLQQEKPHSAELSRAVC